VRGVRSASSLISCYDLLLLALKEALRRKPAEATCAIHLILHLASPLIESVVSRRVLHLFFAHTFAATVNSLSAADLSFTDRLNTSRRFSSQRSIVSHSSSSLPSHIIIYAVLFILGVTLGTRRTHIPTSVVGKVRLCVVSIAHEFTLTRLFSGRTTAGSPSHVAGRRFEHEP